MNRYVPYTLNLICGIFLKQNQIQEAVLELNNYTILLLINSYLIYMNVNIQYSKHFVF